MLTYLVIFVFAVFAIIYYLAIETIYMDQELIEVNEYMESDLSSYYFTASAVLSAIFLSVLTIGLLYLLFV